MAGGTDKGLITVIDHKKSNIGGFTVLGNSSDLKNKGYVICLDIGYNNKLLVAGYSSGIIVIFNLKKAKLVKIIKGIFNNERIRALKFLLTDEPKKKGFTIIASSDEGKMLKIFLHKISNFTGKRIKKQVYIINYKSNGLVLQIEPIFIDSEDKNQKKNFFLACSTSVKFFIINMESFGCEFEFEKPPYINSKLLPSFSLDRIEQERKK